MAEKRHESDPTVPMPASRVQELLAAEGLAPIPDDETPTSPDLCSECGGRGKTIVETETGYRGPVPCPRGCRAPGSQP